MTNTRPPDIAGVIDGGRSRRRKRNLVRGGVAAIAVLAVGGGALALTRSDDTGRDGTPPVVSDPTTEAPVDAGPTPYVDNDLPLAPGTYRYDLETDDDRLLGADLTFGAGWTSSGDPRFGEDGRDVGGIIVTEPAALPGATGCISFTNGTWNETWDEPGRPVGRSAEQVAQLLSNLPDSTVLQAPEPTRLSRFPARHLRVQVHDRCSGPAVYCLVQDVDGGGHGISYNSSLPVPERKIVVDLLVVDVVGNPIVIAMWHHDSAPQTTVDAVTGVRDSITLVTGG